MLFVCDIAWLPHLTFSTYLVKSPLEWWRRHTFCKQFLFLRRMAHHSIWNSMSTSQRNVLLLRCLARLRMRTNINVSWWTAKNVRFFMLDTLDRENKANNHKNSIKLRQTCPVRSHELPVERRYIHWSAELHLYHQPNRRSWKGLHCSIATRGSRQSGFLRSKKRPLTPGLRPGRWRMIAPLCENKQGCVLNNSWEVCQ